MGRRSFSKPSRITEGRCHDGARHVRQGRSDADSVKEAVQLKFNGWQKQKPGQSAPVPDAPSEPAPEDAGEPQREYPTDH